MTTLLTTREVVALTGRHKATIARDVAAGRLPVKHRNPGKTGAMLFSEEDVRAYIEGKR